MEKTGIAAYITIAVAIGVLAYSAASFFMQPQAPEFAQQTATNQQLTGGSPGGETNAQMMARMHPDQQPQAQAAADTPPKPVVSVNFVVYLENGTVFDTNIADIAAKYNLTPRQSYAPLDFTLGSGQVIKGLDSGVRAMSVGETRTLKITPDTGFGQYDPQLMIQVPIAQLEAMNFTPVVGMRLYAQSGLTGTVLNLTGNNASTDNATIDFNNPLAGKTFYFNATLLSRS